MKLIKVALESGKAALKIPCIYKHTQLILSHVPIPRSHQAKYSLEVFILIVKNEASPFSWIFLFLRRGKLSKIL